MQLKGNGIGPIRHLCHRNFDLVLTMASFECGAALVTLIQYIRLAYLFQTFSKIGVLKVLYLWLQARYLKKKLFWNPQTLLLNLTPKLEHEFLGSILL